MIGLSCLPGCRRSSTTNAIWTICRASSMKIGIFLTCQHPPGSDMIAALEGQYAMTRLARDRGWDAVASGQHYLSEGVRQVQLVPFLARLAAEAGEVTGIARGLLATPPKPGQGAHALASPVSICHRH